MSCVVTGRRNLGVKVFESPDHWRQNAYLIEMGSHVFIIDPGRCGSQLCSWLSANLDERQCSIFLTHFHYDHVFSVNELANKFGCFVYGDVEQCDEALAQSKKIAFLVDKVDWHLNLDIVSPLQTLEIEPVFVLETPGHTACSVSYKINNHLFVGDTISYKSAGETKLPGSSRSSLFESLHIIAELQGVETIFPGHGSEFRHCDFRTWFAGGVLNEL